MQKPLRKIVREFVTYEKVLGLGEVARHWEELECGHIVTPKTDMYGYHTNAYRRRCSKCLTEQPTNPPDPI